eukprot:TRINITY_DN1652_c0_g1_i1.p1 TRINITY_DN1652_c0_g1~~TRINITY_DN1652_c0_g1_i1.p1  ORF type:complete len:508 (+),score=79.57 TRINITY_DN1652_c0_g1_i1:146-1669(+)
MQSQFLDACHNLTLFRPHLGFRYRNLSLSENSLAVLSDLMVSRFSRVSCSFDRGKRKPKSSGGRSEKAKFKSGGGERVKVKGKDNVWSVDNELAKAVVDDNLSRRRRRRRRVKNVGRKRKNNESSRVIVSAAMLMEIETVLQTQEPVIRPAWITFASSVSGIWKGVGAVFSPFTAEMEPIGIGNQNENLYDCYTLSRIEKVSSLSKDHSSQIQRKVNWVHLNPYGERRVKETGKDRDSSLTENEKFDVIDVNQNLPSYESFDLRTSDVLEEDFMGMEPGLVFFEDGSYSRGPVDIPVGGFDESNYFLSPTFKFEQCLVKGCHKRLRIVHTIEFNDGGSDIQIIRVAVYEEQWVCPTILPDNNDLEFDLKPFSQRRRTQPSELTGSWKVFEVSATPIFGEEATDEEGGLPYVYLCTETLKKRSLPENPVHFGEEEMLDMQDVAVLWLPGGITGYVDVKEDGILCIGVGWYSDEGINLVMERDYGTDGKLREVRSKSEVKRRWPESFSV